MLDTKFAQHGKMEAAAAQQREHEKRRAELLSPPRADVPRSSMDETIYTADQLDRSIGTTDSIFVSGRDTLARLVEQNETIRGTMGRAQDVGAALGVSRSTMRAIERHVRTDRWLACGAAVLIVVFFFLLFIFL